MTSLSLTSTRPVLGLSLGTRLARAVTALLAWHERARSRRQLAGLNDRLLHDIGLDRATAARELDKRFWQP